MLSEIDQQIISHLRKNARVSLTKLSKKLGIPVSTIYNKVKQHEKNIIKKYTSLLGFSKLGLHSQVYLAIKVKREGKQKLWEFLSKHSNVNSLYRVNYEHDFLAECVFRNVLEVEDFIEKMEADFEIEKLYKFNVIEELKKEEFLVK